MRIFTMLALGFSLALVGCGPNKSMEKGKEADLKLQTSTDNSVPANQQRPTATPPANAGAGAAGEKGGAAPDKNAGRK